MVQRPKVRTVLALATLSAFGLVAAACGGGDGGSSSGTTQGTSAPTVGASEAPSGSTGAGTEAPTTAAAATPTPGGSLVFGHRGRHQQPVAAGRDGLRHLLLPGHRQRLRPADGDHRRRRLEALPGRERDAQRRQHGLDHQGPARRHLPRRHPARRRRGRGEPDPGEERLPHRHRAGRRHQHRGQPDRSAGRRRHGQAAVDRVPALPGRPDRDDRLAHVAQGERQRRRAQGEARRHRPVHLRELRAQRVVQGQAEPELLEQALPVPRRDRVPSHRRRPQPPRRAEERRRADHPHDERADHRRRPQQQGLRARRADLQGRDQLHAAARHAGPARRDELAAHRPARPLRAGQRLRQRRRSSTRSTPASTPSPTDPSRPSRSAT